MSLPTIGSYGQYASGNYGAHCLKVSFPRISIYFSYETIVAFDGPDGRFVSENCWGPTTGKHLNFIDGGRKKARVVRSEFEEKLNSTLAALGLV